MSKTNGATQWIHALILALLLVFALGQAVQILIYDSCAAPDPNPSVTVHDDTRFRAAYEELGLAVSQSRADIISAHDRINAIYWQLDVVLRTCPGQEILPTPPWPVREPQWTVPFIPRDWDALYVRHVGGDE